MSDETVREQPLRTPDSIWEHTCCFGDCPKWGGNGYQEDGETRWYCGEHKHHAEARRR